MNCLPSDLIQWHETMCINKIRTSPMNYWDVSRSTDLPQAISLLNMNTVFGITHTVWNSMSQRRRRKLDKMRTLQEELASFWKATLFQRQSHWMLMQENSLILPSLKYIFSLKEILPLFLTTEENKIQNCF